MARTRSVLLNTTDPTAGDFDGQGDVYETDRVLFVGVMLDTITNPDHFARSDLNGDGEADGQDIGLFVQALVR